jgi:hypothetical protein
LRQARRDRQQVIQVSLIDMTQFDRMDVSPEPDGHTGGRDEACDGVEGELAPHGSPRTEAAVAVPGSLAALGVPPSHTPERHPVPDREPCLEEWGLRP